MIPGLPVFLCLYRARRFAARPVQAYKHRLTRYHNLVTWFCYNTMYTLFLKRNATFKLAGEIHFHDFPVKTCTQTSYECARTMRNFGIWSSVNCYQEHFTNDIWSKIKWCTLFPKRKETSEKLCFFWGRV